MELKIDKDIFKDYAIEFKEVNPEDFTQSIDLDGNVKSRDIFEIDNGGKKIIIKPNDDGYINDELQKSIDLNTKNTVVINAAVGQGKSYAILQTLKRFIEKSSSENKYLIFVASPFVNLVEQYHHDLIELGIDNDLIYNYNSLSDVRTRNYLEKPIQILTVNCLLGNSGENSFKNSSVKKTYINDLVRKCEKDKIKVIFIYDEIHDSYHNFDEKYVFNLWKWKNVIHKNFIISATYNEASKVPIEYLAELTDKRIKIIESERIRISDKQSHLFLHYSESWKYNSKTIEIRSLITELSKTKCELDILCFSKSLAKEISNKTGVFAKRIKEHLEQEIQLCTSDDSFGSNNLKEKSKNKFDKTKCNIGTNFKTGVSIKKKNHSFVVILPPRSKRQSFKNEYGIFNGGINSIIQALARQREKGEIHIILPKPDPFDYESLPKTKMSITQKRYFENCYNLVSNKTPQQKNNCNVVRYIPLIIQEKLLKDFYKDELYADVKAEIEYIKKQKRTDDYLSLEYTRYEEFKLKHGENYLSSEFPIFGEDLSAYVTYSSLTNQFINCELQEIYHKTTIVFNKSKVKNELREHLKNYFPSTLYSLYTSISNFMMFYILSRNWLFENFQLKVRSYSEKAGPSSDEVKGYNPKTKEFEIAFLEIISELFYGLNFKFKKLKNRYIVSYDRANYVSDNIYQTKLINKINLDENEINRYNFFKIYEYFINAVLKEIKSYTKNQRSFNYIETYNNIPQSFFSVENREKFKVFKKLINSDLFFSNDIFSFKNRVINEESNTGGLIAIYRIINEDFFELEGVKITPKNGKRENVNKILLKKEISQSIFKVNTIESPKVSSNYLFNLKEYNKQTQKEQQKYFEEIISSLEI